MTLLHACVLTYMSDLSSGLIPFESDDGRDRRRAWTMPSGSTGGPGSTTGC